MNYALIEDGKVVNVVVADESFASEHGLIQIPDNAGIGWSYIDGQFVDERPSSETIPTPTKEDLLAQLQALQAQIAALGG